MTAEHQDRLATIYQGILAIADLPDVDQVLVTVNGAETIVDNADIDEICDFAGGVEEDMCFQINFGEALTIDWTQFHRENDDYQFDGRSFSGTLADGRSTHITPYQAAALAA